MDKRVVFSIRELVVILFSGGVPVILAYMAGGITELENIIGGLIAPELFLYYCAAFPIVFAVFYFADKYLYINPLSQKQAFLNFVISTLYELSTNIIGIFRLACGVLLTFPFLVLAVEAETSAKLFLSLFPYGLLGGIEVTLLYWWFSKAKLKQSF